MSVFVGKVHERDVDSDLLSLVALGLASLEIQLFAAMTPEPLALA